MDCFVGSVAQGAADADGIVITQVASYFTYYHGNECILSKQKGLVCENRLVYNGRKNNFSLVYEKGEKDEYISSQLRKFLPEISGD